MTIVHTKKKITGKDLEKIIKEAGEKMGWKSESHDRYKDEITLGSVSRDSIYQSTNISLRGRIFEQAEVTVYKDKGGRHYFFIDPGRAKEEKIDEFLDYVSERV